MREDGERKERGRDLSLGLVAAVRLGRLNLPHDLHRLVSHDLSEHNLPPSHPSDLRNQHEGYGALDSAGCLDLQGEGLTCLPSSQGVATVVMKNCEPLVFFPALAIDS
eukprot:2937799-Rhodomonas_salina.3